ncbi:acyltransferase [Galbitalea sp. SE-J8]|uniref:acyltransferase family protein n=1 Tax=Galbitalea sp. SE-J8 TaxID=3054952 RepID=UPI00259C78BD|nr:acyltransferase [Galbitalea sp. SE-J8]MDM4762958.1 acyltransferase [Galbitalea sp. SE-J8]
MRASLSQALNGHDNALGIIRLALAAAVIFDHSWTLGGWGYTLFNQEFQGQTSLGGLAVYGFFAISGYLITKSGIRADIVQFLWRRVLRIFPAFLLVLTIGAFVLGPIAWRLQGHHHLSNYFSTKEGGPVAYLLNNWTLTIQQWGVYDVFAQTPFGVTGHGSVINGALWTLTHEWFCYLMIGALVLAGALRWSRVVVPAVTLGLLILKIADQTAPGAAGVIVPLFGDPSRLTFALVFFAGACAAAWADRIPFDDRIGVVAALVAFASLVTGGFTTYGFFPFAYVVLYLAARLPRPLRAVGRKNDYSYGLYLWGWPVQQCLAALGVHQLGYWPYALLCLLGAFGCAVISWHGLERWAMRLHNVGPGRGVAFWRQRVVRVIRREPAITSAPDA